MTKAEICAEINRTANRIHQEHGIPCRAACQIAAKAVFRAAGLPVPAGLGAAAPAAPASQPAAPGAAPEILAEISAAGSAPGVSAVRDIVGKWSWLIPVGGLIMSAKSKFTSWRASSTDPAYAASRSLRKR